MDLGREATLRSPLSPLWQLVVSMLCRIISSRIWRIKVVMISPSAKFLEFRKTECFLVLERWSPSVSLGCFVAPGSCFPILVIVPVVITGLDAGGTFGELQSKGRWDFLPPQLGREEIVMLGRTWACLLVWVALCLCQQPHPCWALMGNVLFQAGFPVSSVHSWATCPFQK